ncbi:MAG: Na+/H+ antiporter NhaC family protein [Lachnospiraceae bacterium]|nr:Na+/H+ antiporter NhaC family protein [Lachnospiraceae bacterium]
MEKGNAKALLPIGVFLVMYLGLGLLFEYVLLIPMGFYNIPIVVSFLTALLVACVQNPKLKFDAKIKVMAKGVGDPNIITMILIFMAAGIFVGVVGRSSAESVAYFLLSIIPAQYAVLVLFIVSCFVSLAMGTSVGTITLISPIAIAVATGSGFGVPLCIGAVMGGAMFGDNLSFISDTTIAACNGQGCAMKDKFRANFGIALPAALVTLIIIFIRTSGMDITYAMNMEYDLIQIIPYILVLIGGIIGINVFVVLIIGIVSGSMIMLATGAVEATALLGNMGSGAAGMYETTMVAILVAAICALIDEYGGFVALLNLIKSIFKGRNGGKLGMGLLVGAMDIATANNTVAIVMANPIAKEMAEEYDITPQNAASILDTFSCIFQGVIPYGAQMLVAISAAAELGHEISAFDIMPHLLYPYLLLVSSLIFMFVIKEKRANN